MHLLCRLVGDIGSWNASPQWREYVLPALAGDDVDLVEYLWEDATQSIEVIEDRLPTYASARGWGEGSLLEWGAQDLLNRSTPTHMDQLNAWPSEWQRLWASGAINITLEPGTELHSAALAVLGQKEELSHRFWRGQAEPLLPVIDRVRLTICDHMTRRYWPDWPTRWARPAASEQDSMAHRNPLGSEWGYLDWLLANCSELRGEQRWSLLVSLGHWIRNEIAHYGPVPYLNFQAFWQEAQRAIAQAVL